MKKFIALLMAVVMLLSMAACSSQTAEKTPGNENVDAAGTDEKGTDEKTPVTLKFWYFAVAGVDPIYEEFAEKVHNTYPWITVELECLPNDTGPEKFTVACATGTTPDIYSDGYSRIAAAVNAGLTLDISDIMSGNADLFYSEQAEGKYNGEYHYIATENGAPYCMLVNMSLAEKLGVADMLPADREVWTYDEFLEICRAAKAADSTIYPVALFAGSQSGDAWDYSWFLGNGAELLNADHTATVINEEGNREKIMEVLDLYQQLIAEGLVPDGVASMTDDDVDALYFSGRLLLYPTAYNYLSWTYTLQQEGTAVAFDQDAVCLPTVTGSEPPYTTSWGSFGYCAFGGKGHDEDTKLVLDLLIKDTEIRNKLLQVSGKLPLMVDTEAQYETAEITTMMERAAVYGAKYSNSSFGILEPFWSDFRPTFYVLKQDLFVGKITPEQFVETWAANADAVISDYLAAN